MTDAEVLDAIRAKHLKGIIGWYEEHPEQGRIRWDEAWIDPGFGLTSGPYAHVPITLLANDRPCDEVVYRVRAPERLRRRLAAKWQPSDPRSAEIWSSYLRGPAGDQP